MRPVAQTPSAVEAEKWMDVRNQDGVALSDPAGVCGPGLAPRDS